MADRQSTVSRRQFLTTVGAFAAGVAALAACGTTATPTVAPAATTAPAAAAAPATTAPTAAATAAATARATTTAAASSAPTTAPSTATSAGTATVGTRTTATAAASGGGDGDVPNGNFGGSKFYSTVVDQKVEISSIAGALKWDKAQYTAKVGDVTFVVKNLGPAPHQLGVETSTTKYESGALAPNSTTNLTIKGLTAGDYDIVCNIPGHKAAGMVAKLTVS